MSSILQNLTAAQINSLNSTLHALEVQTTILKTLIRGVETVAADESAATIEPKKKTAKAPKVEEENDDDGFDMGGDDEEEKPEPVAPTKENVISALQAYANRNGRKPAIKVLKDLGVKSVHDLKAKQFPKILEMLA